MALKEHSYLLGHLVFTSFLLFADAPGREAEFESTAGAFEHQANQITDTAIQLANAGGNTNKRLLDQIRQNAEEVSTKCKLVSLGPQKLDLKRKTSGPSYSKGDYHLSQIEN